MRRRCPGATPLGPALLRGWRYVIAEGYGSVAPAAGMCVFGVLWRLTPRDLAALNMFESLDSGLYRRVDADRGDRRAAGARAGLCRPPAAAGAARCRAIRSALVAAARGMAPAEALYCGAAAPRARLSRRAARPRPERSDERRPPCRYPRPCSGRRLSRLCRGRGRAAAVSKAGCATGATALSRRCLPGRERGGRGRDRGLPHAGRAARGSMRSMWRRAIRTCCSSAVRARASPCCRRHETRRSPSAFVAAALACGRRIARKRRRSSPTRAPRKPRCTATATATRPARNGPTAAAPAAARTRASRSAPNIGIACQPKAISVHAACREQKLTPKQ